MLELISMYCTVPEYIILLLCLMCIGMVLVVYLLCLILTKLDNHN